MTNLEQWLQQKVIGETMQSNFIAWLIERFGEGYAHQWGIPEYDYLYDEYLHEWSAKNQQNVIKALLGGRRKSSD